MASAKQFLSNKTAPNAKVAVKIKSGQKVKITDTDTKVRCGTETECLAFKCKEFEGWIALNNTSLLLLIDAWGDDSEEWHGKSVKLTIVDKNVSGEMKKEITVSPV